MSLLPVSFMKTSSVGCTTSIFSVKTPCEISLFEISGMTFQGSLTKTWISSFMEVQLYFLRSENAFFVEASFIFMRIEA